MLFDGRSEGAGSGERRRARRSSVTGRVVRGGPGERRRSPSGSRRGGARSRAVRWAAFMVFDCIQTE
ncbi:hypothetical protein EGY15_18890 [Burkholderia pseudomallei]|nr:hypothetical protein EGY15_18890 [Burkholderia pseudomallei]